MYFSESTVLLLLVAFLASCVGIMISLVAMVVTNDQKQGEQAAGMFIFSICVFLGTTVIPFALAIFPLFTKCLLAAAAIIAIVSLAQRIGDRYLAKTFCRAGA